MKKIYITCIGCARRLLDASKLENYFELNGCKIMDKPDKANIIIFVTCSFKEFREKQCLNMIKDFRKNKAELIVLGCLPGISDKFKETFEGRYLSTKDLDQIDKFFPKFKIKYKDTPTINSLPDPVQKTPHLQISSGCLGNCSYCGIKRAIGSLKSKPIEICKQEYKKMLGRGHRQFILLADDVGAYGLDIKSSFAKLLDELSEVDKRLKVKWIIKELHPRWAVKYEKTITKYVKQKKISGLLCAIQSGSDRILKRMNRYHKINQIIKIIAKYHKINPEMELATQVIIGFPTETEKEFKKTLKAIKKIGFNSVFLYPYSNIKNTTASKMEGKIEKEEIIRRLNIAQDFLDKLNVRNQCDETKTKRVSIIGDSHSREFFEMIKKRCLISRSHLKIKSIPAASAQGLTNPHSKIQAKEQFIAFLKKTPQPNYVCIMLGNVDCDFVLWYRKRTQNITVEEQIAKSTQNLIQFIEKDLEFIPKERIILLGANLPSVKDQYVEKVLEKYSSFKPKEGITGKEDKNIKIGSFKERTHITKKFNKELKKLALKNKIKYVDITRQLNNPITNVVKKKYLGENPHDHHLDSEKVAKLWANKLNRVLHGL